LDRDPAHLPMVANWIERFGPNVGDRERSGLINFGKLTAQDTTHLILAKAVVKFQKAEFLSTIEDLRMRRRRVQYPRSFSPKTSVAMEGMCQDQCRVVRTQEWASVCSADDPE
jgi:hypothetical protein